MIKTDAKYMKMNQFDKTNLASSMAANLAT